MLSIREYLEAGETTISNLLFDHYQKIGLKDDEFLFLLQLFRSQNAEIGRASCRERVCLYV